MTRPIPEPRRTVAITCEDGTVLPARVYGKEGALRTVWSHGNGLAIDGYRVLWEMFLDEYEVVVFDQRSHGRSELSPFWRHTMSQISRDMEVVWDTLQRELGPRTTVGAFHSLSSLASINHFRRKGPTWHGLVLFDPPIMPPNGHPLQQMHRNDVIPLSTGTRRRRYRFDSPDELAGMMRRSRNFRLAPPDALDDLARATLKPDGKGGWVLACPRELEAHVFDSNQDPTFWNVLGRISVPMILVCGDPDVEGVQPSAIIDRAAAQEMDLDYACVPNTTHFLQIENPQACRDIVVDFIARNFPDTAHLKTR